MAEAELVVGIPKEDKILPIFSLPWKRREKRAARRFPEKKIRAYCLATGWFEDSTLCFLHTIFTPKRRGTA